MNSTSFLHQWLFKSLAKEGTYNRFNKYWIIRNLGHTSAYNSFLNEQLKVKHNFESKGKTQFWIRLRQVAYLCFMVKLYTLNSDNSNVPGTHGCSKCFLYIYYFITAMRSILFYLHFLIGENKSRDSSS